MFTRLRRRKRPVTVTLHMDDDRHILKEGDILRVVIHVGVRPAPGESGSVDGTLRVIKDVRIGRIA